MEPRAGSPGPAGSCRRGTGGLASGLGSESGADSNDLLGRWQPWGSAQNWQLSSISQESEHQILMQKALT